MLDAGKASRKASRCCTSMPDAGKESMPDAGKAACLMLERFVFTSVVQCQRGVGTVSRHSKLNKQTVTLQP